MTNEVSKAKELLGIMNIKQAIYLCEQLAERLPSINNTPPVWRHDEDRYRQFWIGVKLVLSVNETIV